MSDGFNAVDGELTLTLEGQAVGSIANNLTTDVEGYALDARQGKVLDEKKLDVSKVANNRTTVEEGWALDARQGKWLSENKVGFADVANDLATDDKNKVLSAAQGKALDEKKLDAVNVVNNLTTNVEGYALDARQGKYLDENKVSRSDVVNDLATNDRNKVLSAAQGKALKELLDEYQKLLNQKTPLEGYPVGSIYLSVNSTSPASLFGGTWTQLQNRFLLGAGSSYANGTTGGEAAHVLTVDEMPSHNHGYLDYWTVASGGNTDDGSGLYAVALNGDGGGSGGVSNWRSYTANTGGGAAHNNMPPYLVVYMWKRVS